MSQKAQFTWAGLIGSTVGGFIPSLWGADMFSLSGIIWGLIGGVAAIALVYKLTTNF